MKIRVLIILTALSFKGLSQHSYSGFIDKYPIQLVTDVYSDGEAQAIYAYDKYDTPIIINGKKKSNRLVFVENDAKGAMQARLVFNNFSNSAGTLSGEWINRDSTKRLKITLVKQFEISYEDKTAWANREIIQSESTDQHYFKLLISKEADDNARVTGIKILEKKTDRLIQKIDLDCQLWGLNNTAVGDYNFDGIKDFSVFESSYAGSNTSSIYVLRQPASEKYTVSDYAGTSLEFDAISKRITERNVCCAGTSLITGTYKVVNNKMVLIEKKCFEYNEEKQDYVEIKCE